MKVLYRLLYIVVVVVPTLLKKLVIDKYYKSILEIDSTVSLGDCVLDCKNIRIGEGTYIKSGEIFSGCGSVDIGKFCAIGSNVSIKARTHDLRRPTANEKNPINLRRYGDISIGNYVWVGDNVFIREGVVIGDHAVIGANSVVVSDVPQRAIVGGIPAKFIRDNDVLEPSE